MKQVTEKILKFRDDRDWKQYHTEKDLAISIALEASELLENFQWKTSEQAVAETKQNMKEEISDIFIYLIQLVDKLGIDLEEEVYKKLEKNAIKYPAPEK
ncbi:nucleotide pyrophosphohydrolase [Ectobacillus polymachus]|uniref:nucleotide pyrophosphohydrolase n=1 Tax=Ectobacillus polymachus TaxID=1508806 RepID=UPI003A83689E